MSLSIKLQGHALFDLAILVLEIYFLDGVIHKCVYSGLYKYEVCSHVYNDKS